MKKVFTLLIAIIIAIISFPIIFAIGVFNKLLIWTSNAIEIVLIPAIDCLEKLFDKLLEESK